MHTRRCTNKDHSLYSLTLSTGIVRVVNASDFATVATIQTGTASAFCSMFVPFDETCVVVCDQLHFSLPVMNRKGFIRVFNYQTGEKKIEYQMANECYSAALLCGGKMILAGDKEHIYFYELETGRRIGIIATSTATSSTTSFPTPSTPPYSLPGRRMDWWVLPWEHSL